MIFSFIVRYRQISPGGNVKPHISTPIYSTRGKVGTFRWFSFSFLKKGSVIHAFIVFHLFEIAATTD